MGRPLLTCYLLWLVTVMATVDPTRAADKILYDCPDLTNKEKRTLEAMTQGYDGWFFRTEGDLKQQFQLLPETASYFRRAAEAFNRRGTALVFLTIPSRGITARELLNPADPTQAGFNSQAALDSYKKMVADLRATGLIVPDLAEIAQVTPGDTEPFFFKRDHHWTSWGARKAAQALAATIANHPNYQKITKLKFQTKQSGSYEMLHTMGLEIQHLCTSPIPAEPYAKFETAEIAATGAEALFGDENATDPSVLVGSSFSAQQQFNFDGFLSEYTGLDIANSAMSAGLLFNAIVALTSSADFEKTKPPFLIWETSSIYNLNIDTAKYFRQLIPAIYGSCSESTALASGKLTIKQGQPGALLHLPAEKQVSGHRYYLFLEASDLGLAKFTLQLDYADDDGEWISIDRSEHFNNTGRFFVELSDDIDSPLISVAVDDLPDINATLSARLCRVPE